MPGTGTSESRGAMARLGGMAVVLLALNACAGRPGTYAVEPVRIQSVATQGSPETARTLRVILDNCSPGKEKQYTAVASEGSHVVRITVRGPVWQGEAGAACANSITVALRTSLGARKIVDGTADHDVSVTREG